MTMLLCVPERATETGFGNRIETRRTERSATAESTHRQPQTPTDTVGADCLMGILGTRGKKAARRDGTVALALVPLNGTQGTVLETLCTSCPQGVGDAVWRHDTGASEPINWGRMSANS
jgi:hypothetical protein